MHSWEHSRSTMTSQEWARGKPRSTAASFPFQMSDTFLFLRYNSTVPRMPHLFETSMLKIQTPHIAVRLRN